MISTDGPGSQPPATGPRPPDPSHDSFDDYRTPRFNVIAIILLAMVSLTAAVGITLAINSGDESPSFAANYFGDIARLSQRAAADVAQLAPGPADRAACLKDDGGEICTAYAQAAQAVADRMQTLIGEFSLLQPPSLAAAWHREYRAALERIERAFGDQARAITAQRLDAFQAAARRADAAVAQEIALSDQFNLDFAAQLAGA
ncbi:MAG: hypothetical protein DK306_000955 [Chloroflexi bacterium]|nr:MAG: hypothetical protein DK306_000955 [Chloroflexota bacterium]